MGLVCGWSYLFRKSWSRDSIERPIEFLSQYVLKFAFLASNNTSEYKAIIRGLELAKPVGVSDLKMYNDS